MTADEKPSREEINAELRERDRKIIRDVKWSHIIMAGIFVAGLLLILVSFIVDAIT